MTRITWIYYLLVFGSLVVCNQGFLNLYLNSTETRRLLGIEGDLYYVRNGTVNDYALTFNLLIRPEHHSIYFTWQNLRAGTRFPMYYSITLETEDMEDNVMAEPNLSIAPNGQVPSTLSVFSVYLPCLGQASAEINIKLFLEITIFGPSNITSLEIRRRKSCLVNTGDSRMGGAWFDPDVNADNPSYNYTLDKISRMGGTPTNIFYIAVGCACGFILLVALVVAIYYVRSQKSTSGERLSDTSSSKGLTNQTAHSFLRPETPSNSVASAATFRQGYCITELKPSEVRNLLGEIHIERSSITLGDIIMEGTFGRIYHGTVLYKEDDQEEEQDVVIKTVAPEVVRKDQVELLMKEACLMKDLAYPNLLPVVAACIDNDLQPLLIYNYSNETNLKKFLLHCKVSDLGPHQSLSTQQFVYIGIQVCRGLQFLHRRRVIHKDAACRNCVVDSQWSVKVTDTALSRDLFPNDYHCLGDNENRPVKWLSPEALQERRFSPASDVWSFGVLLWELMMMGQQPYADIDPFEMATYLKKGYRVAQPHNCPDELFAVMACCWSVGPDERPKITQLQLCLQDFYQALGRFV